MKKKLLRKGKNIIKYNLILMTLVILLLTGFGSFGANTESYLGISNRHSSVLTGPTSPTFTNNLTTNNGGVFNNNLTNTLNNNNNLNNNNTNTRGVGNIGNATNPNNSATTEPSTQNSVDPNSNNNSNNSTTSNVNGNNTNGNSNSNNNSSSSSDSSSDTDSSILGAVGSFLNGLIGIIFWVVLLIPKIILLAVILLISAIITGGKSLFAMPDVIFFNKVEITNLMMFISPTVSDKVGTTEFVVTVSTWFRVFYLVAIGLLFLILIYIAIRALMSSLSQNLAEVKEMLTNWLVSVFILATLVFVIAGTILLNNFLLDIIRSVYGASDTLNQQGSNVVKSIFSIGLIQQITGMIMAGILIRQTVQFLIAYINRVIKIAFFIIIAPFIAVSYTMDKMKDKKAQALSYWNKQFIMTVMIQPFHAILFIILMSLAQAVMNAGGNNGIFGSINPLYLIIVVLILNFIEQAEKELNKLFDLSGGVTMSEGKKLANAFVGVQALKTVTGVTKKVGDYRREKYESKAADKARETAKSALENRAGTPQISNANRPQTTADARNQLGFGSTNGPVVTGGTANAGTLGANGNEVAELNTAIGNNVETISGTSTSVLAGQSGSGTSAEPRKLSGIIDKTKVMGSKATRLYADNLTALTMATLGVAAGGAGGFDEMTVGGTVGWLAGRNLRKNTSESREKNEKREKQLSKYTGEVEKQGEIVSSQVAAYGEINGIDMNKLTDEGRQNIQAYFDILRDNVEKDSKAFENDYKKKLKDFKKYLMDEKGKTVVQAEQEARKLLNDAKSGKINMMELDSDAAKDFASAAISKSIADNKKNFEEDKFKLIKGDFEDVEKEVLAGTKTLQAINKEWNDTISSLAQTDVKVLEDKEKELKEIENRYNSIFENRARLEATINEAKKQGISREDIENLHEEITKEYQNKALEYRNELDNLGLPEVDRYMDNQGVKRSVNRAGIESEIRNIYMQEAHRTANTTLSAKSIEQKLNPRLASAGPTRVTSQPTSQPQNPSPLPGPTGGNNGAGSGPTGNNNGNGSN